MPTIRKSACVALMFVAVPACIVLVMAALPLVIVLRLWGFAALRWHCWRTDVWTYLVCSPRRGWNELLVNNVLPGLPAGLGFVWASRDRAIGRRPEEVLVAAGFGRRKPYLAHVRAFGIRFRTLNECLRAYKSQAKIDAAVRREVHALIEGELGLARSSDRSA